MTQYPGDDRGEFDRADEHDGGAGPEPWPVSGYDDVPEQRTDPMAIAALVFAFLCAPVGLVLGLASRSRIARRQGEVAGAGFATAAIVIGGIFTAVGIVVFVLSGGLTSAQAAVPA